MDTGLRRYDGTESRYRCADHRCTCIFEGGHEGHEGLENYFSELRALRAFVMNTSCARQAAELASVIG